MSTRRSENEFGVMIEENVTCASQVTELRHGARVLKDQGGGKQTEELELRWFGMDQTPSKDYCGQFKNDANEPCIFVESPRKEWRRAADLVEGTVRSCRRHGLIVLASSW